MGSTLHHSRLEGRQVYFVQGPFGDRNINACPVILLVVGQKMFHTGRYILRLQCLDVGNCHLGHKEGIFAQVFKVSSAKRRTDDVYSRTKQDIFFSESRLFSQNNAALVSQRTVPTCSQGRPGRETGGRIVGPSCIIPVVQVHLGPYSMWSVGESQSWNSQSFHSIDIKFGVGVKHSHLFFEGHLLQQRCNLLLLYLCIAYCFTGHTRERD